MCRFAVYGRLELGGGPDGRCEEGVVVWEGEEEADFREAVDRKRVALFADVFVKLCGDFLLAARAFEELFAKLFAKLFEEEC